jgi:signal transduction histidine kinase
MNMIHVLGCIVEQHDLRLVLLAGLLCVFACGTAITMILRARLARHSRLRLAWLAGAGMVAGCGIWATHFVAMLAYDSGLPMAFAPGLTILSMVIAMGLCGLGFALAIGRAGGVAGGLVTGIAICAMHYTGMAALELPADAVWLSSYVIASVLIGVSLSGLAMHLVMRRTRGSYAAAAGIFTLAIVGMHFTAMSAVHYIPDSTRVLHGAVLEPFSLALMVAGSAAFILAQGLIVALVDRYLGHRARGEALRMRVHIAELEATQANLEKASFDLSAALDVAGQANRSKAAFLASMSHELRTPLNAVIGFSETMLMEVFGPLGSPRYRDYISDINASGTHLLSLINDVLDLSRLDAGQAELQEADFDLADLVGETLRMVSDQAAKARIALSVEIAPDLPYLRADRRRIKQILLNLLSNAVKFTPRNGRVRVLARQTDTGLVLAVSDTGIGIAPADIPRALERFGQVDSSLARKYQGTGLGLPLSRELAELHGGSLTLESAVDVGTTASVTLPAQRLVPRPAQNAVA